MGNTPRSPYSSMTLRSASVLSPFNANSSMSPGSVNSLFFSSTYLLTGGVDSPLANSPHLASSQAFQLLHRPAGLAEKARINAGYVVSGFKHQLNHLGGGFGLKPQLFVQPEVNCDLESREVQRSALFFTV